MGKALMSNTGAVTRARTLRRGRGAAMTEAVVMMPFFLLIFFGVQFVHRGFKAEQLARQQARTCAWISSEQACGGELPDYCRTQQVEDASEEADDANASIGEATGAAEGTDAEGMAGEVGTKVGDGSGVLVGKSTIASGAVAVDRPPFLGGGSGTVGASYHLPCNMHETTPLDVLADIWGMVKVF